MLQKGDHILTQMQKYYDSHPDAQVIVDIIRDRKGISLRVLDWFVTNYSKKHNTAYVVNGRQFPVYLNYKSQLKGYSKKLFDPFGRIDTKGSTYGRRERIVFRFNSVNTEQTTTVGQLNFFKWAYDNLVIAYAIEHCATIDADMRASQRAHPKPVKPIYTRTGPATAGETVKAGKTRAEAAAAPTAGEPAREGARTRKKRQELSAAAVRTVTRFDAPVMVSFA